MCKRENQTIFKINSLYVSHEKPNSFFQINSLHVSQKIKQLFQN